MHKSVLILAACLVSSWAYPTGAPITVCDSMMPGHQTEPQSSPSPVKVILGKEEVKAGEVVDITLSGKIPFKGFLVEVRKDDTAVGEFLVDEKDPQVHTLDCHKNKNSAVTQSNAAEKTEVVLKWKAPDTPGDYVVYITIVEKYSVFWVKEKTETIKVVA